jgi:UDP:flavonoid glycosyltransferase YjiC (YdhE family)
MLLVPYFLDQYLQAHFFERAGAAAPGAVIDSQAIAQASDQALLSQLRDTLGEILERNGRFAEEARRIQRSYREHDGGQACAERLLALA